MSILDGAGWPLILIVATAAVGAIGRGRPSLALGVLLAAASLSGITAPVFGAGVRPEQPAAILVAALVLVRERAAAVTVLRRAKWPIAFASVFLAANVASALIYAPDPAQSLKICLWLAISLVAALVAAVLVVAARSREPRPGTGGDTESDVERSFARWSIASACIHAAVAAAQVIAEFLVQSDWGVLRSDVAIGKAFGLTWEPNLLAIQLAAAAMFLIDPGNRARCSPRFRVGGLALIATGLALSLSRGGIVAVIAGTAVFVLSMVLRGGRTRPAGLMTIARTSAILAVIGGGGYLGLSWLAENGVGLRPGEVAAGPAEPPGSLLPVRPGPSPATRSSPTPTAGQRSPLPGSLPSGPPSSAIPGAATPAPASEARHVGAGDTIELRVRNLQIAVADGMASPLIGLGPDTFGQRYVEPTCACPAHIPNQLSATFYESGALGLGCLIALIGWLVSRAWKARLDPYLASLIALLVGFQFTDALRFGGTWILIGTIVGLVIIGLESAPAGPTPSGTPRPSPSHTSAT
jgi:hypothetical protein